MNLCDSSAESSVGHVVFHNLNCVGIVNLHPTHLIEGYNVPMTDKTNLSPGIVIKQVRAARFTTGDQNAIRGHLAEGIRLSGASWAKFDEVEILFDKRDEARKQ